MKQIRMVAILMALVLGVITSCTKDNNGTAAASTANMASANASGTAATNSISGRSNEMIIGDGPITTTLENATWKITGSSSSETNEEFLDYLFNFGQDNYLTATYRRSHVYDGYWSVDENKNILYMNFGEATSTLALMDGFWKVLSAERSMVRLQREDGSATLVLEKTENTF